VSVRVVLLLSGTPPAHEDPIDVAHVESWDWYSMINPDLEFGRSLTNVIEVEVESVTWINRERAPTVGPTEPTG